MALKKDGIKYQINVINIFCLVSHVNQQFFVPVSHVNQQFFVSVSHVNQQFCKYANDLTT